MKKYYIGKFKGIKFKCVRIKKKVLNGFIDGIFSDHIGDEIPDWVTCRGIDKLTSFTRYVTYYEGAVGNYSLQKVTKAEWDNFKESTPNKIFSWTFSKYEGRYLFGCGAVSLTKDEISEFVKNRADSYREDYIELFELKEKIRKSQKQIDNLQYRLIEEKNNLSAISAKLVVTSDRISSNPVTSALYGRNVHPNRINIPLIKRIFKIK